MSTTQNKAKEVVLTKEQFASRQSGGTLSENNSYQIIGQAVPQYETMPTASATYLGEVAQFIGTTGNGYIHNHFYECTRSGTEGSYVYAWTIANIGISGTHIGANWSTLTINGVTKDIPSGGGGGGGGINYTHTALIYTTVYNEPQNSIDLTVSYSLANSGAMSDESVFMNLARGTLQNIFLPAYGTVVTNDYGTCQIDGAMIKLNGDTGTWELYVIYYAAGSYGYLQANMDEVQQFNDYVQLI